MLQYVPHVTFLQTRYFFGKWRPTIGTRQMARAALTVF